MARLSADSLIAAVKVIFAEYGIPHRIMSDAMLEAILYHKNSKNSVIVSTSSRQCPHHTTIKVTDK